MDQREERQQDHDVARCARQRHRIQGRGRRRRRGPRGAGPAGRCRFSGHRPVNVRPDIAERVYKGRTASIGFAHGPFVSVDAAPAAGRSVGTPRDEEHALRAALASAGRQVAALAEAAGGEAAQILEFPVGLLEDEGFLEPPFAAIRDGTSADAAWTSALAEQIADYNFAVDEYLQARSSDLADLRDRVLRTLRGGDSERLKVPGGAVICADDLPPSRFLEIDWSDG